MAFNFKLEAHDTWKLFTRAFHYSKRLRTSRIWFYVILSCIFFLYTLGDQPLIYSVTQTFIWCALIFPITIRTLHFIKNEVFVNVHDLEERRLNFNVDGVEQISSSKTQFFAWDLYDEAAEDTDYFFLFDKEKRAIALPKRVVDDEEELKSLRNLLTANIQNFTKHEPSPIR